jgi:hypothetical protein
MIALPAGVQVYLAAGATDMRKYAGKQVMRRVRHRALIYAAAGSISALHNGGSFS